MKRVLSFLLALALTLSVAVFSADAEDTAAPQKYGKDVIEKLTQMSDDEKADFIVQTAFDNDPTKADIDLKVAGLTPIVPSRLSTEQELIDYYLIRRTVRDDMKRQAVLANMEKMGVTFDDVKADDGEIYTSDNVARKGLPYFYSLTKAQVERLAAMDEVTYIGILYPTGALIMSLEEKMSDSLMKKLLNMNDTDRVGVWAWQYGISDQEMDALIRENFGDEVFMDEALYRRARLLTLGDYYASANQEIADYLGAAQEDQIFISSLTPSFILYLTRDQVYELAYLNKVNSIDLYEVGFYVPEGAEKYCDTDDPLFNLFMSWGNSRFGREVMPVYGFKTLYTKEGDWSIIHAPVGGLQPWEVKCGGTVGNRFVYSIGGCDSRVSSGGYLFYDAITGEFCSLTEIDTSTERYREVADVVEKLNIGLRMGDVDTDGEITIFDATHIQRILADLEYAEGVETGASGFNYDILGDYDCDGEMTVLDATAIQRHLAGLEE